MMIHRHSNGPNERKANSLTLSESPTTCVTGSTVLSVSHPSSSEILHASVILLYF